MMNFKIQLQDDGVLLRLSEQTKKLLTTQENQIGVECWDKLSAFHHIEALGVLRAAEEESSKCRVLADGYGYHLSFEFVSSLEDVHARALNLPATFPYQIQIKTSSNIGSPNFAVRWQAFGKGRHLIVQKIGCFLNLGEMQYRLPSDILKIITCIDDYNNLLQSDFEIKTKFVAELKSILPLSPNKEVGFEGELETISLQHASAFSLQITGDKNSINFNPILFHKSALEKILETSELLDEKEQILSPNDARNFSAAFKNANQVNATYLLGSSNYIYIDASLKSALDVVLTASKLSKEKRIEFAKAPQKYIRAKFGKNLDDLSDIDIEIESQLIDQLFIETKQFSDRVIEVGIWKMPDLPWLKTEPSEWLADNYSFWIQGKIVCFPVMDLEKVIIKVKKAKQNNAHFCEIGGEQVTPSCDLINSLTDLSPIMPNVKEPKPITYTSSDRIVLLTKENFENLEYYKNIECRVEKLTSNPPRCLSSSTTLKVHQQLGVEWLVETYNRGLPGVLMADDMGLGKTLQALVFLAIMVETGKTDFGTPILIVAPVSLLKNWQEEHEKHLAAHGLGRFGKLYGNGLKQFKMGSGRDIETGEAALDAEKIKRCDWLLTTYETLRDYQVSFGQVEFSCVIFDELQKAKNPRSLISKGAKVLNAEFSVGLTGTPVENSLADLWTIMDILRPGRLGDLKTFLGKYPTPKNENDQESINKLTHLSKQLLEKSTNAPAPILRRMKADLKNNELPEKIIVHSSETTEMMPEIQENAYAAVSNRLNGGFIKTIDALAQFKTISLHPVSSNNPEQISVDEYIKASARLKVTFAILDEIQKRNEKVLLFIERRSLQPILASIIKQKYNLNTQPLIINGLISGDARQKKVNAFQKRRDGFDAMIISPKAGGVGLTLTAANNVIHVERWWNPAVEDQCTDRAYRIGQTNRVRVYTPIARSESFGNKSFDCVLDELLNKKRSLASGIFMPTVIEHGAFGGALKSGVPVLAPELDEIDRLEYGVDFEELIITWIRRENFSARRTPVSHDYGADIIVKNRDTKKSAIIQCKHRADKTKNISDDAACEVLTATKHYGLINPALLVVTNAESATEKCRVKCRDENIILVLRDDLARFGEILNQNTKT